MAATHLTEGRIRALRPRKAAHDIRDASLKGFGVRVYPNGRKRYFIHTQHDGQRIWKIVGDATDINLAQARRRAQVMLAATRNGTPASSDETLFETVAGEVFRRNARTWKPGTLKVNRYYLRNQILPCFKGRQIAEITRGDVQQWVASLHATPVAADWSAPVLSVIMARAEDYGYRPEGSNPCRGIRRYRRQGRERFCSADEVCQIGRTLQDHEARCPMHVAIIRLLLLTGCRRQEIVSLRWMEYREGHLHLRDSKTGPRTVFLNVRARAIIDRRMSGDSVFVFPSPHDAGRPLHDGLPLWYVIRREADIEDVRLHDLRHYSRIRLIPDMPGVNPGTGVTSTCCAGS